LFKTYQRLKERFLKKGKKNVLVSIIFLRRKRKEEFVFRSKKTIVVLQNTTLNKKN